MAIIPQVEPLITAKEADAARDYLNSGGWLTEFEKSKEFAGLIADFLGVKYVTLTTSGTVALYLSLLSSGLKKGDQVLVPNLTMIATINAIKWAGFEPVVADIDPLSLCVNIDDIDSSIKAILYVSFNGRSGDLKKISDFCKREGIVLIEDAAQAFGSKKDNQFLGTFGDAGVFSFTPHKIITTGQGGALVTNNFNIYKKAEQLKDFYRRGPGIDIHEGIGFNFKFTDLQAVIGIEQIKTIDERMRRKKEIYKIYTEELESVEFVPTDLEQTVPWFIDILLSSRKIRDELILKLKEKGIGTRPFYPTLCEQKPYLDYKKRNLSVSEDISNRGLWLPSSLKLSNMEIKNICHLINKLRKTGVKVNRGHPS